MKRLFPLVSFLLLLFHGPAAMAARDFYIGPSVFLQRVSATNSSYFGYMPELAFGYGRMMENTVYLSGELEIVPFSGTFNNSINAGSVSTGTASGFGASFIPGMKLSDNVLGYLRAGLMQMRFPGPNRASTGLELGLGLGIPINNLWDFRAEYRYTTYRSITELSSPTSNAIGAGVIYHFDAIQTFKDETGFFVQTPPAASSPSPPPPASG